MTYRSNRTYRRKPAPGADSPSKDVMTPEDLKQERIVQDLKADSMFPLSPAEQITAERCRIIRTEGEEQLRAIDAVRNRVWT